MNFLKIDCFDKNNGSVIHHLILALIMFSHFFSRKKIDDRSSRPIYTRSTGSSINSNWFEDHLLPSLTSKKPYSSIVGLHYATFERLNQQCGSRKRGSDTHRAMSARFTNGNTTESDRADFHTCNSCVDSQRTNGTRLRPRAPLIEPSLRIGAEGDAVGVQKESTGLTS